MPAPLPTAPQRRERERPGRRRGGVGAFLLAGALPVAAAAWIALLPASEREALLARVPAGWAGRATHAAISFGVLVVLARVALPAFHGARTSLAAAQGRLARNRGLLRALLAPLEALVGLLGALARALFALDALLIVACCLVLLLLVVRIVKPEALPGVLPWLGR